MQTNMMPLASCTEVVTSTLVIAGGLFWVGFKGGFNAAHVFPVLSLVLIVSTALGEVPNYVLTTVSSYGCLKRIQEYQLLEEHEDKRIIGNRSSVTQIHQEVGSKPCAGDDEKQKTTQSQEFGEDCAVAFQNVTLKVGEGDRTIISDASFEVKKNQIAMLIGSVGSGKSTLLQAILGEICKTVGTIYLCDADISYCGQTAWAQNLTIQESIVGSNEFDEELYRSIIDACHLRKDLEHMPDGDQTTIGSNGSRISGGQKQRLVSNRVVSPHPLVLNSFRPLLGLCLIVLESYS